MIRRRESAGVRSLWDAYLALGRAQRTSKKLPPDASPEMIEAKVTNPGLLRSLGVPDLLVRACHDAELACNLLDTFYETGRHKFLSRADEAYQSFLKKTPAGSQAAMRTIMAFGFPYFQMEQYFAQRIKEGDTFSQPEVISYQMARCGDALFYAELARVAGYTSPSIRTGIRLRQALWDLADDIVDVEIDRQYVGANVLLMKPFEDRGRLSDLATMIHRETKTLELPRPLHEAIDFEYDRVLLLLK